MLATIVFKRLTSIISKMLAIILSLNVSIIYSFNIMLGVSFSPNCDCRNFWMSFLPPPLEKRALFLKNGPLIQFHIGQRQKKTDDEGRPRTTTDDGRTTALLYVLLYDIRGKHHLFINNMTVCICVFQKSACAIDVVTRFMIPFIAIIDNHPKCYVFNLSVPGFTF